MYLLCVLNNYLISAALLFDIFNSLEANVDKTSN